ncbi:transposase [Nostoc sp.]|uniref:transposase n=1 Tax=Nostoc sp. TaxID=1180 RepID=UPI002FF9B166
MKENQPTTDIREIRILPWNQCFYGEFVYKMISLPTYDLNQSNVLGIDPGINNWLTCVSNVGTSIIIDTKHLKSMNQYYNKRVSTLEIFNKSNYLKDAKKFYVDYDT